MIEDGVLSIGEELKMNYADLEFTGIITEDGKIKTKLGTSSVSQSAADMIKESGKSRRKKNTANGYSEWRNKSGSTLSDLRGEDINEKGKNPKLKGLKEMIREGILNNGEEIYLFYRDEKYTGKLTMEGKIETELGTFGIGQATLEMMHMNPKCESSLDTVNGYNCWRIWNGTKLKDLDRA